MCGRFSLTVPEPQALKRFQATGPTGYTPSHNIAPSQRVLVITKDRQAELMEWGLAPTWSKGLLINARKESLDRPAFSRARNNRVLIIADGFYEWKEKAPYRFVKNNKLFAFAGIYEVQEGSKRVAIITAEANEEVKEVHSRKPVVLREENEEAWLSAGTKESLTPATGLTRFKMSTDLSRTLNEQEQEQEL